MQFSFKGNFVPDGSTGKIGLDASADTSSIHQPSCVGKVILNDDLAIGLELGSTGKITGKTPDKRNITIDRATLAKCKQAEDGSIQVAFDFRRLEIENESNRDLLSFPEAYLEVRWYFSSEPTIDAWLRTNSGKALAQSLTSKLASDVSSVSVSIDETLGTVEWDTDGIKRSHVRSEPSILVSWKAEAITPGTATETVTEAEDIIELGLMCLGFAVATPLVIWRRDEWVATDAAYEKDVHKLFRSEQRLGQAPLFAIGQPECRASQLDQLVEAGRLDCLAADRGHLEPAIQSYLWAPSLPLETNFIAICTALEALKEWYLGKSGTKSNFLTNNSAKKAEKAVRTALRQSEADGTLAIPLDEVLKKAAEIRRPPFRWALERLIEELEIAIEVMGTGFTFRFIATRNSLIHTGHHPADAILREDVKNARTLCKAAIERILSGQQLLRSGDARQVDSASQQVEPAGEQELPEDRDPVQEVGDEAVDEV